MSYQDPYPGSSSQQHGQPSPAAYNGPQYGGGFAYGQPPRKRKGLTRIIVGSIGLLLNLIGFFVMPWVAAIIVTLMIAGSAEPIPIDPGGGRFQADQGTIYTIAVPVGDVETAECTAEGSSVLLQRDSSMYSVGTIDGVEYVELYDVEATGTQEVTLTCTGTTGAAVVGTGVVGTLVGFGVGLVVPIGFGLLSLILLIWGIVARVRS